MQIIHGHIKHYAGIGQGLDIQFWYDVNKTQFELCVLSNFDSDIPHYATIEYHMGKWQLMGFYKQKERGKTIIIKKLINNYLGSQLVYNILQKNNELLLNNTSFSGNILYKFGPVIAA